MFYYQITAETAYDMVSPGPSVKMTKCQRRRGKRKLHRPQDIREGVTNAYFIVKDVSFDYNSKTNPNYFNMLINFFCLFSFL